MALVFDLNTGRFSEETPTSKAREQRQVPELHQSTESNLDLALTEITLTSTPAADPILADITGVDTINFIRRMEQKNR